MSPMWYFVTGILTAYAISVIGMLLILRHEMRRPPGPFDDPPGPWYNLPQHWSKH